MPRGLNLGEVKEAAEELRELAEAAGTPIVVTAHRNADPDAVASAYSVRTALRRLGYDARLVLPEGMSQASKRVVKALLGVEPGALEDEAPGETALLVAVDTASREQLGRLAGLVGRVWLVVIDHHATGDLAREARLSLVYTSAASASEITYFLVVHGLGVKLEKGELELLLAGIAYDTRHFTMASPSSLYAAAEAIEAGASLQAVLRALQSPPPDVSQRIARVKAAKRMHVIRAGDVLAAVTHVGSYESSAARALIDLGVDIAVVASSQGEETRVVARARRSTAEKYSIDLGKELMAELASRLGGSGGGHAQAAAATVKAGLEKALAEAIKLVEEILSSRGLEPRPLT